MSTASNPSYKQLTLSQLRCLCETARRGSFVAAAGAMGVSHPTVWKQVHALEREFGVKLVEPHGRGCLLTSAGQMLIELAGPSVESIATLEDRFRAKIAEASVDLTIAVTPRTLVEDLAPCVVLFHARHPKVRYRFMEMPDDEVAEAVEMRRADFGFTPSTLTFEQQRTLVAEPCYVLEVRLVTAKNHPLARRRTVRPADLRPYPFVNGPDEFSRFYARTAFDPNEHGDPASFLVQANFTASIRRFVELGFGIGLVHAIPSRPFHRGLHERSMNAHFPAMEIQVIRRRGAFTPDVGEEFIQLVRAESTREASNGRRRRRT
jgi:molybdate transport repressor ModE-like protein